jgi:hypothetical protein
MTTYSVVGTCGNCGGEVRLPNIWWATIPPIPRCENCGARPKKPPTIEMEPGTERAGIPEVK